MCVKVLKCSALCVHTAGEHSGAHLRAAGAVGRRVGGDGVAAARDALGLVLLRGRRARHAQQGGLLVPPIRSLRRAAAAAAAARDRRRRALTSDSDSDFFCVFFWLLPHLLAGPSPHRHTHIPVQLSLLRALVFCPVRLIHLPTSSNRKILCPHSFCSALTHSHILNNPFSFTFPTYFHQSTYCNGELVHVQCITDYTTKACLRVAFSFKLAVCH